MVSRVACMVRMVTQLVAEDNFGNEWEETMRRIFGQHYFPYTISY